MISEEIQKRTKMKKILFVEDDPILGPVYEKQLLNAGFNVTLATDGEAGLQAVQETKPDLIVLDIDLPVISGVALMRIIRDTEGLKDLPVFVFTSAFDQGQIREINALQPEAVLIKSKQTPSEVVAKINVFLRRTPPSDESPETVEPMAQTTFPQPVVECSETETNLRIERQLKKLLGNCRSAVSEVNRQTETDARSSKLHALCGYVHNLSGGATAIGLKGQAHFCEALRTLIEEVANNPARLTESNMRTITQAVDFLFEEFDFEKSMHFPEDLKFNVLVVDDDAISRRAICVALNRINQKAIDPVDVKSALNHTQKDKFDLIFLDVDMPEMSGFDLCSEIRKTEKNRETPVIFVTGLTDLQSRAQSMLSGGNDFIGKPFQFMELAVKSLIHLFHRN